MNTTKRKKIFYIPGIFSLMIIPVLFIHFAKQNIKATSFGVIPLFLADTNWAKKHPDLLKRFKGEFPPKRIYSDIVFTDNKHANSVKLAYAQIRIREILAHKDTIHGVHFHFSDSSSYGIFVKSVDILRQEGAKTYMPLDNELWFYLFPPD